MKNKASLGMIGLGTMGRNLLQNMADHNFTVTGYDKSVKQVQVLNKLNKHNIIACDDLIDFLAQLTTPRVVMLLVPAGEIVDAVINEISPLLAQGDLIIDGGNSKFTDTERRSSELATKGLHFFGMGVSGGEEGARFGPSMMPGGDAQAYETVKPIFEAIAAKVENEPCVAYLGPRGCGNYVKMVHNGIEYALMQLIAETYAILKNGLELPNQQIQEIVKKWHDGRLQSYLLEITSEIFQHKNPETGNDLLDDIKDEAKSKGTGKWTSQFAMDIQCPIPSIDIAVSTRDLSKYKSLRTQLGNGCKKRKIEVDNESEFIEQLENVFYFTMSSVYAQGMHLLFRASQEYAYALNLGKIAKIWRGGCIIRAAFLENIMSAYEQNPELEHLFLDNSIQKEMEKAETSVRSLLGMFIAKGISVPVISSSLAYYDALHTERMPTNLIQAQRDFFGAHTYELMGKEGVFHTNWNA